MSDRWRSSPFIIAVIVFLVCPSLSFAKEKIRFGVSAFGGYNRCQMTDLNKHVQFVLNEVDVALASTGGRVTLDGIGHGTGLGGGLHAWATENVLVCAEYERLFAKTSKDETSAGTAYHTELTAPANGFTLTGAYFIPSPSKARFGLGAGVGYYSTKVTADLSSDGRPATDVDLGLGTTGEPILTSELKGHGFGVHGLGIMDYAATREVHLDLRVGGRYAKTAQLEDKTTGEVLTNAHGKKVKADWSGPFARLGFTFLFGKTE